ncbi:hypothetical protein [Streptomyces sp. NPDC015131]|uniref:hypothetical protein n=1 Tax=Streptomyces sp. NPDC015131 TaxID=3364941 RepID=UPI003702E9E9
MTVWGFGTGALVADPGARVTVGLIGGAAMPALSTVLIAVVRSYEGRRARRWGLSTNRYVRIGHELRRGRVPDEEAERGAAREIAERQRRMLGQQSSRVLQVLAFGLAAVWLVTGVSQLAAGDHGSAALTGFLMALALSNPWSVRRSRRRLERVEARLRTGSSRGGTARAAVEEE